MNNDTDYDLLGFVSASKRRKAVLTRLGEGPATPSTLATETSVGDENISHVIRELRQQDLVALLVDEDRKKGRLYGVTELGEDVLDELNGTR